jgi:hypothetical protein
VGHCIGLWDIGSGLWEIEYGLRSFALVYIYRAELTCTLKAVCGTLYVCIVRPNISFSATKNINIIVKLARNSLKFQVLIEMKCM